LRARAALLFSLLSFVCERVESLDERHGVSTRGGIASIVGLNHSQLNILRTARAAFLLLASRLLALQLALGSLAVGGLHALVVAFQFLAHRRAFGFGGSASGVALSRGTDSLALGAIFFLAIVLGAADRAHRALAVNNALSTSSLFASHLTLGTRADRVADSWALRVIALPAALRVALFSDSTNHTEGKQSQ